MKNKGNYKNNDEIIFCKTTMFTPQQVKTLLFAVILVMLLFSEGCYHSRIIANDSPATDYEKETVHSIFWGLSQTNIPPDSCHCPSGSLAEVRYSTNLGYTMLNVITLGFWSLTDIEWKCAKAPPPVPEEQ